MIEGKVKKKLYSEREMERAFNLGGVAEARGEGEFDAEDFYEHNTPIDIELKYWSHTCGDGCCFDCGVDVFVDGEDIGESGGDNPETLLESVLGHLGYKVNIESK